MRFFETGDRFVTPTGAQIKYTERVQRLGICGAKLQRLLQILVSTIAIVQLPKTIPDCRSPPGPESQLQPRALALYKLHPTASAGSNIMA